MGSEMCIRDRMALDLVLYVAIRALLALMEWFAFGTRRRGIILSNCKSYEEWRHRAETLDRAEGRDVWRSEPSATEYDWRHIDMLTKQLALARIAGDTEAMMRVLHHALKPNVGGIHEEALYRKARAGTKVLLEDFIRELGHSVQALADFSVGSSDEAWRAHAFLTSQRAFWGRGALVSPWHRRESASSHGPHPSRERPCCRC